VSLGRSSEGGRSHRLMLASLQTFANKEKGPLLARTWSTLQSPQKSRTHHIGDFLSCISSQIIRTRARGFPFDKLQSRCSGGQLGQLSRLDWPWLEPSESVSRYESLYSILSIARSSMAGSLFRKSKRFEKETGSGATTVVLFAHVEYVSVHAAEAVVSFSFLTRTMC
jgi:hypothetical protein